MDGWTDEWTVGHDGGNGQEGVGWAARPSRAGKTGRGGRTGQDGRTGTGCPSMNAALGRRP